MRKIKKKVDEIDLDDYEREILEAFERGDFKTAKDSDRLVAETRKAARKFIEKNKRINIRMNEYDVSRLKFRAVKEGVPYQTLISSILHKYVNGYLVDSE